MINNILKHVSGQAGGCSQITKNFIQITSKLGEPDLIVSRVFDAPRELVFKTYVDPNLLPQWWGPRNLITIVDKMELRPGGTWRFINREPDGKKYTFSGVYLEILPFERYSFTFNFEGRSGRESTETVTFEDQGGKTKVTDRYNFKSVEDRDEMIKFGLETGAAESMDRFGNLLEKLQKDRAC